MPCVVIVCVEGKKHCLKISAIQIQTCYKRGGLKFSGFSILGQCRRQSLLLHFWSEDFLQRHSTRSGREVQQMFGEDQLSAMKEEN